MTATSLPAGTSDPKGIPVTDDQLGAALLLGVFGLFIILSNRPFGRTIEILVGTDAAAALGYRRKPGGNYITIVVGGSMFIVIALAIVVYAWWEN